MDNCGHISNYEIFVTIQKTKNFYILWKVSIKSTEQEAKHKKHEKTIPKYIIMKLLKTRKKEKSLKQPEEKTLSTRGTKVTWTADSSLERIQVRGPWNTTFTVLTGKNST